MISTLSLFRMAQPLASLRFGAEGAARLEPTIKTDAPLLRDVFGVRKKREENPEENNLHTLLHLVKTANNWKLGNKSKSLSEPLNFQNVPLALITLDSLKDKIETEFNKHKEQAKKRYWALQTTPIFKQELLPDKDLHLVILHKNTETEWQAVQVIASKDKKKATLDKYPKPFAAFIYRTGEEAKLPSEIFLVASTENFPTVQTEINYLNLCNKINKVKASYNQSFNKPDQFLLSKSLIHQLKTKKSPLELHLSKLSETVKHNPLQVLKLLKREVVRQKLNNTLKNLSTDALTDRIRHLNRALEAAKILDLTNETTLDQKSRRTLFWNVIDPNLSSFLMDETDPLGIALERLQSKEEQENIKLIRKVMKTWFSTREILETVSKIYLKNLNSEDLSKLQYQSTAFFEKFNNLNDIIPKDLETERTLLFWQCLEDYFPVWRDLLKPVYAITPHNSKGLKKQYRKLTKLQIMPANGSRKALGSSRLPA